MNCKQYIVFLFSLVLLHSCEDKKTEEKKSPPPPTPVVVGEVTSANAVYYDEYPGTVAALNEIKITAQVTGYITGMYFKDGQKVVKGQKLYSIDQQVYQANYQQAVANMQVQQANLNKAQKDADRYHELARHDAVAKQQVDYADAALEAAKKQVESSQANINSVRANVRFSNITAPLTGTIGISQVKQGTSVVAGQTILNTISTDDPIAVDFAVDQKEIYRFSQLQQTGMNPKDSIFTLKFGNDIYPYPGSITVIDRAVDPQTGTMKVRLQFPNSKGLLKAGMNTNVRIKNSTSTTAAMIPYKAVTEQLGEFFVYVVGDSNKVSQRMVQLGRQVGKNVIVNTGVAEGDKIVIQGVQNLHEGSVITTAPPKKDSTQKK
jgi:membrane fusion protein, multidrug efflux system